MLRLNNLCVGVPYSASAKITWNTLWNKSEFVRSLSVLILHLFTAASKPVHSTSLAWFLSGKSTKSWYWSHSKITNRNYCLQDQKLIHLSSHTNTVTALSTPFKHQPGISITTSLKSILRHWIPLIRIKSWSVFDSNKTMWRNQLFLF